MNKADRIRKNAVKAGTRYAKKHSEGISKEDLLSIKVQTMSGWLRWFMGVTGIILIAFSIVAWPSDGFGIRCLEMIGGLLLVAFGIFGIRRTISNISDVGDLLEFTVDGVGSVIGGIFDL